MSYVSTIAGNVSAIYDKRVVGKDKQSVLDISVAVNHRKRNPQTNTWEDGTTTFQRVTMWGRLADNFEASVSKGDRVIVHGTIATGEDYTDKEGNKRTPAPVLTAKHIGPDLSYATAVVTKNEKGGAQSTPARKQKAEPQTTNDAPNDDIFDDDIF